MRAIVMFLCLCWLGGVVCAQPLAPDPAVTLGRLPNGLRTVVLPMKDPSGRVCLWMHVGAGSILESDGQRGLAHYLEHMAFNGSANFPPGTLVPFFEGLGLTFGQHQNAFTGYEQTTYQLSVPAGDGGAMRKSLVFFGDVLARLTLSPEEIEKERGIILGEVAARASVQQRMSEALNQRLAPGSLYAQRSPIGIEATIRGADHDRLAEFYKRCYTPAGTTILVVGDVDPGAVGEMIGREFGGIEGRGAPEMPAAVGGERGAPEACVLTDPDLARTTLAMVRATAPGAPVTTVGAQRREWVARLAVDAFNRRMADVASGPGTPFQSASVLVVGTPWVVHISGLYVTMEPARWESAALAAIGEVERVRRSGFEAGEVEGAKKAMLAQMEREEKTEPALRASVRISRLNRGVNDGRTITSAAQRLALAREVLPTITPEEVSGAFRDEFVPERSLFALETAPGDGVPDDGVLLGVVRKGLAAEVRAPGEPAAKGGVPEAAGQPGEVVESEVDEATGVWSAWLSNGVRVHFRAEGARPGQASIAISLVGSELLEDEKTRGLSRAGVLAWSPPSTASAGAAEVRAMLRGHQVEVSGRAGTDVLQLRVSGAAGELELGMRLAGALLREPRVEQAALDQWKARTVQDIGARRTSPPLTLDAVFADVRYPAGDARQRAVEAPVIEGITREGAQAWLEKLCRESPIEVAVVGDVSRERAVELVAKYVGSLPARERVGPGTYKALRALTAPSLPRRVDVRVPTRTPQSQVLVAFPGPDASEGSDVRAMRVAAAILSVRMNRELREARQLVYGIATTVQPGSTYPGFGVVVARAPAMPDKAPELAAAVTRMFDGFAKDGPTGEEVDVAVRQALQLYREGLAEPTFWLDRLELTTFDGSNPADVLKEPEALGAVTREGVLAVFRKYYSAQRLMTITVRPEEGP